MCMSGLLRFNYEDAVYIDQYRAKNKKHCSGTSGSLMSQTSRSKLKRLGHVWHDHVSKRKVNKVFSTIVYHALRFMENGNILRFSPPENHVNVLFQERLNSVLAQDDCSPFYHPTTVFNL